MRPHSAIALPLSFLAATAQTAAPPPSAATPAAMATYRNDTLHLSYSYPATYTDAASVAAPAFETGIGQDPTAARCLSLPFSRMQTGTGQIGLLFLVRADAACLKKKFTAKSVAEFAQGEAQGIAAAGAKTSFGPPVSFEVASRPAARVQGSFALPTGQSLQAMVVCILTQPDIACWQFLAGTPAAVATMAAFPVTFDNTPPAPLVPPPPIQDHSAELKQGDRK